MKIIYKETKPETIKVIFIDKEMEEAHEDYINNKRDILNRLNKIIEDEDIPAIYRLWIDSAYKFIEETR